MRAEHVRTQLFEAFKPTLHFDYATVTMQFTAAANSVGKLEYNSEDAACRTYADSIKAVALLMKKRVRRPRHPPRTHTTSPHAATSPPPHPPHPSQQHTQSGIAA
jgi:hypothetical protein